MCTYYSLHRKRPIQFMCIIVKYYSKVANKSAGFGHKFTEISSNIDTHDYEYILFINTMKKVNLSSERETSWMLTV